MALACVLAKGLYRYGVAAGNMPVNVPMRCDSVRNLMEMDFAEAGSGTVAVTFSRQAPAHECSYRCCRRGIVPDRRWPNLMAVEEHGRERH